MATEGGGSHGGQTAEEEHPTSSKPGCTGCKVVGTGGCLAGAVYAFSQRSKLPITSKNRHWLAAIGVGELVMLSK